MQQQQQDKSFNDTQAPPCLYILTSSLKPPNKTLTFHKFLVLSITFLAYASFHASRKPPSIVKSILGPTIHFNSSTLPDTGETGWAPFNGPEGPHRLGELDLAFLSAYALGMFFAGHVGDRINLRLFLVFGMVSSGVLTIVFGLGYWLSVHSFGFYVTVQFVGGLFQSIGWPCVVSIVGNWFGKDNRGLIMGIWNSHMSVGNIIGSVIASSVLEFGWGWSFLVPGVLVILVGVLVFGFLVVRPEDLGFEVCEKEEIEMSMEVNGGQSPDAASVEMEEVELLGKGNENSNSSNVDLESSAAIGFFEAWRLPGVAPFAFCLFFSKLVAYTFLYWLPFYIRHTAVAGVHLSHKTAGIFSTVFDIGGVFGGIIAGHTSDVIGARAVTAIGFLFLSIPALVLYRVYGSVSMITNIALMFLSGLFVNGPYSLITTAVSTDLGTQEGVKGNARALATVTAIIDGTGSVGGALGPLLAGYISTRGWNSVFSMLILSICFASLLLIRLVKAEIRGKIGEAKWFWSSTTA
ncbi:hypothetical protein ACFE04_002048 [Oxalis oulophora]